MSANIKIPTNNWKQYLTKPILVSVLSCDYEREKRIKTADFFGR
jgi:hypothetical protein